MVQLPLLGDIYNMHTNLCMWLHICCSCCKKTRNKVHWALTLGEKSLTALLGSQICVSNAPLPTLNWATSLPRNMYINFIQFLVIQSVFSDQVKGGLLLLVILIMQAQQEFHMPKKYPLLLLLTLSSLTTAITVLLYYFDEKSRDSVITFKTPKYGFHFLLPPTTFYFFMTCASDWNHSVSIMSAKLLEWWLETFFFFFDTNNDKHAPTGG